MQPCFLALNTRLNWDRGGSEVRVHMHYIKLGTLGGPHKLAPCYNFDCTGFRLGREGRLGNVNKATHAIVCHSTISFLAHPIYVYASYFCCSEINCKREFICITHFVRPLSHYVDPGHTLVR